MRASLPAVQHGATPYRAAAQHPLQWTRLTPLSAKRKRAQAGLVSKGLRRTRRATEFFR